MGTGRAGAGTVRPGRRGAARKPRRRAWRLDGFAGHEPVSLRVSEISVAVFEEWRAAALPRRGTGARSDRREGRRMTQRQPSAGRATQARTREHRLRASREGSGLAMRTHPKVLRESREIRVAASGSVRVAVPVWGSTMALSVRITLWST